VGDPLRLFTALLAAVAFAASCDMTRERPPAGELEASAGRAAALHYRARLAPELDRLDVEVCTGAPEALELRPGRDEAAYRLRHARSVEPLPARRVYPDGRGMLTIGPGPGLRCVVYTVSLSDGGELSAFVRHRGEAVVSNVNAWLYRPEKRTSHAQAHLTLELPAGMDAALPYPRDGRGEYVLDAAAFRFDAYAVFGRFTRQRLVHARGALDVVALDGAPELATLAAWAQHHLASLEPLALERGALPSTLIVLDAPRGLEPFGSVARGGAGSVLALVPATMGPVELSGHWMLVHELSHFALPFVRREDAWLSEGFATYLQEVLPSRAGKRPQRATLELLAGALTRVETESEGLTLADESLELSRRGHYRTVYWGGAALCLILDVALLARSRGRMGLVELAARLRAQDSARGLWSADALVEALDAELGEPVVRAIVARELARAFPDFRAALFALGVRDGAVQPDLDNADTRALRSRVLGAE
jgi:hypothetical protein